MSDSLREQLLQAGFAAPKADSKQNRKTNKSRRSKSAGSGVNAHSSRSNQAANAAQKNNQKNQATAVVEQRKALKAQIKALIESTAEKDFAGDIAYRFTVKNRIRELYVKEAVRAQLVAGTLIITRLNGTTQLVPENTAIQIRALNPDWAIFGMDDSKSNSSSRAAEGSNAEPAPPESNPGKAQQEDDDYADYQVPDDLVW